MATHHKGGSLVLAALLVIAFASADSAHAVVDVAHFSVAPSTSERSAHPNLRVSIRFGASNSALKDIAFHLPAGLTANPSAIPFCSRKRLLADLCSSNSKAGSLTIVGEVFGFELSVTRKVYNLRPTAGDRLRLAVPIFGSFSRPGIAAELPVTERPGDKGLDMAVVGLPRDINGIAIRASKVSFAFRGVARTRVGRRLRKKAFLTNPPTCTPATSVLELTSHDAPTTKVTRTSSFTPTGCGAATARSSAAVLR
jgi:hypothetical protein